MWKEKCTSLPKTFANPTPTPLNICSLVPKVISHFYALPQSVNPSLIYRGVGIFEKLYKEGGQDFLVKMGVSPYRGLSIEGKGKHCFSLIMCVF